MKIITASLLESYGGFLSFYKVGTWRGSKLQIREKPLLTRYVLVNLPENAAWGSINEADGVNRVLSPAMRPPAFRPPTSQTSCWRTLRAAITCFRRAVMRPVGFANIASGAVARDMGKS